MSSKYLRQGPVLSLPAFLICFALGACGGQGSLGDPGLILEVAISPTPPAVGVARLIITLHDTIGSPISGAEIVVEGVMDQAGSAPVLDTAAMVSPGQYSVPDFRFPVAGDWVLTLQATLEDGRTTLTRKGTDVVGAH